jgi:hypothetical protein
MGLAVAKLGLSEEQQQAGRPGLSAAPTAAIVAGIVMEIGGREAALWLGRRLGRLRLMELRNWPEGSTARRQSAAYRKNCQN